MITEWIAHHAIYVLEATGYAGVTLLMALESMIAPVPSEAVMPFVGFLVADGAWSFWPAVAAASTGSLAGSALSYAMGYYGGRPFVLKVGKYLLLNTRDLEWTERFFHENRGTWTVFFCRHGRHDLEHLPAGLRAEAARALARGAAVLPPGGYRGGGDADRGRGLVLLLAASARSGGFPS